jgi:hypothetical protein
MATVATPGKFTNALGETTKVVDLVKSLSRVDFTKSFAEQDMYAKGDLVHAAHNAGAYMESEAFFKILKKSAQGIARRAAARAQVVDVTPAIDALEQALEVSELHGVAYTPVESAKVGDIVKGPKTLVLLADYKFQPGAGTLVAFLSATALQDFIKQYGDKGADKLYITHLTVTEYEVGALIGSANYWKQHVTKISRLPYSAQRLYEMTLAPHII